MLYAFEHYELDTRFFELRRLGVAKPLQPKPLDLLLFLLVHRERVVLKSELLQHLWPNVHVTENALVQAIASVRGALADAGSGAIVSVRGRGYRFTLPVSERVSSEASPRGDVDRKLCEALAGREGGFVVDALDPEELEACLARAAAKGTTIFRAVAGSPTEGSGMSPCVLHGDSPATLSTFRSLLARVAEARPDTCAGGVPLTHALAEAHDEHAMADLALSLFQEESLIPSIFVLEHLERSDVASVLLFAMIASARRPGLVLVGTCAWGEVGDDTATSRILAPLSVVDHARHTRSHSAVVPGHATTPEELRLRG